MSNRALVRPPSATLEQGLVTHQQRQPVDVARAREQWQDYCHALDAAGWDTVEVAAADQLPDAVFVEDTVVMFGETAVLTRPGANERVAEVHGTEKALRQLGYRPVDLPGGRLDGGDVLKVGRRCYVGVGGRTDPAGVAALRTVVAPLGYLVTAVPTRKVLHLKSAVTALPDESVIGYPPLVDDPGFFPLFRAVPEEAGAHVVDLGGGRVLMSAAAPRSAELIAGLGFEVISTDIGEFEKLEGCVTCLSVRLRD